MATALLQPSTDQSLHDENRPRDAFRNYETSTRLDKVLETYRLNHKNQTVDFVRAQKKEHLAFNKGSYSIWDMLRKLDELVDESDPDTDYPQIIHALQTAEAIRVDYSDESMDWMPLVGLLHDLGKILALPEFGGLEQWAVVGDTFPVGCAFSQKIVAPQFFSENPDSNNHKYNTHYGMYEKGTGLDNLEMSWGHDEYMYQVCKHNKCTIPQQGLNMIRYHSFYPWHKEGEYTHLLSENDAETKRWVLLFNEYDLYTKSGALPDVEKLVPYYKSLIKKYFPNPVLQW